MSSYRFIFIICWCIVLDCIHPYHLLLRYAVSYSSLSFVHYAGSYSSLPLLVRYAGSYSSLSFVGALCWMIFILIICWCIALDHIHSYHLLVHYAVSYSSFHLFVRYAVSYSSFSFVCALRWVIFVLMIYWCLTLDHINPYHLLVYYAGSYSPL